MKGGLLNPLHLRAQIAHQLDEAGEAVIDYLGAGDARLPISNKSRDSEGEGEAVVHVATQPVNLRAEPSNGAEVLTVVGEGELVRRIGRDGGRLRVRYANRFAAEFTGWVHGSFLTRVAAPTRWADRGGSEREP